jgi:hypothetical protein
MPMPKKTDGVKKCLFCMKDIVFKPSEKGGWVHVETNQSESKEGGLHNARPVGNY